MKCSVSAYDGDEAYIFLSYCHKDKQIVYPLIEQMANDGYRIWYDDGLQGGDDWPNVIAQKLKNCAVFLPFITQNAVDSHNCRNEITFALNNQKSVLAVYKERIALSIGMQLQLANTQALFYNEYPSDRAFLQKLYHASCLASCNGGIDKDKKTPVTEEKKIIDKSDDDSFGGFKPPDKPPVTDNQPSSYYITRVATREVAEIRCTSFVLGRSQQFADFIITGNKTISRTHATITKEGNRYYITDNASSNGTKLNGRRLKPNQVYSLQSGDTVQLSNEKFIFSQMENRA